MASDANSNEFHPPSVSPRILALSSHFPGLNTTRVDATRIEKNMSESKKSDDGPKNAFGYPVAASPDNQYVFQRVPWENRVHWLRYWNPKNDPNNVDCMLAFNTLAYCQSPLTQLRNRYDEGSFKSCSDEWNHIRTCIRVKALARRDYAKAQVRRSNHPRLFDSTPRLPLYGCLHLTDRHIASTDDALPST